jgi:hypothetical protein
MNNHMNYSIAVNPRGPSSHPGTPSVRRLIRCLRTGEYFRGGQWTSDPNLADQFADAGKVVDACVRYHLVDVELVLEITAALSGVFETHLRLLDQPGAAESARFGTQDSAAA